MRILIAGTHSGCGKTTVTLALMRALVHRGLAVAPYKVGPDYIDPGFHRAACGRMGDNLDTHLMRTGTARALLTEGEQAADIAVIEGVMGYYDGRDSRSLAMSTYEMAGITETPAILVVDASGASSSAAAVVKGFAGFTDTSHIEAVIVNRVSGEHHYRLVEEAIRRYTGIPCLGYLRKDEGISLGSRHLGLIPALEVDRIDALMDKAARSLAQTVDIDALLRLAAKAPQIKETLPGISGFQGFRLGVALDEAFHFYYKANLDLLKKAGMELVFFSPLHDRALPDGLHGLYIGGGFPEVFKEGLSQNASMRASVLSALEGGLPCYAECGGMMYLSESIDGSGMVGFLPVQTRMTERLQRFGYLTLTDEQGRSFPAHSFHHSVEEETGAVDTAFTARRVHGGKQWREGYRKKNTLAGYPHLHFADHPFLVEQLWGKKPCGC